MNDYLRLLEQMFPGKIYLDEQDVGTIFGLSPLTIIEKKYKKSLPFNVCSLSTKFRVSIVELAKYMEQDGSMAKPVASKFIVNPLDEVRSKQTRKSRSKLYRGQVIG